MFVYQYCKAQMWYQERTKKYKNTLNPKFHLCCGGAKIQLALLNNPSNVLNHLLFDHGSTDSKNFQQHIRANNMMFAFTSLGAKVNRSLNNDKLRIQG